MMAGKKLQGQVAIITGAGRGLGAAVAERLVRSGAMAVLTARTAEEIEAVAARLRKQGGRALAVPADITDPESVEEVVEAALDQFNRVDILINNAGLIWPVEQILDVDAEEWTYNVYANLIAPFFLVKMVLPLMLEQGAGRILNITADSAHIPAPGLSAYAAAKAGLEQWTRTLAMELRGQPVAVNLFNPGPMDTRLQEDLCSVDTTDTVLDFSADQARRAQGDLLAPAAAADLVCWLVGPWARGRSGELFTASDRTWVEQVHRDLL